MSLSEELLFLEVAVRREKAAPELLTYETYLIEKIVEQLENQQQCCDHIAMSPEEYFKMCIIQMDLDRRKYLLSTYHRTRLCKIQHFMFYITHNELGELLSPQEYEFVQNYYKLKTNHFKKCFTMYFSPKIFTEFIPQKPNESVSEEESLKRINIAVAPNLDQFVMVKIKEDIGNVSIGNSLTDFKQNEMHLIPYKIAKNLLESDLVDLY